MTGPRAAVRITLTAAHLDNGWITRPALRELQGLLYDVPERALVTIDLGPLQRVDRALVQSLALLPCGRTVRLESPNWRIAQETALELALHIAPDGVGDDD